MTSIQVEIIAKIPVEITILRRGYDFGYQINLGTECVTGWTTQEGRTLESRLHAWRTALKRAKNQGLRAPGLTPPSTQ